MPPPAYHQGVLVHIALRDLAIVERLELALGPGMTAITGETGAGKSILVDAVGLALGDRAEPGLVRAGAERAEVSLVFDLERVPAARAWLAERELDEGAELVLRRTVGADGRSRGWINGRPVTMQALQELGALLVDVHGQHAHQSLVRPETQRELLDAHGGHGELRAAVAEAWERWRAALGELETLEGAGGGRDERLDLLRYQTAELETLGLDAEGIAALEAEHRRLAHAGRLLEGARAALDGLYEAEAASAHALLARAAGELERLAGVDPALEAARALVDEALIRVDEAAGALRDYLDGLELDPERLAEVERRLGQLHDLARKHRVRPEELPAVLERLRAELDALESAGERLEALREEATRAEAAWREAAARLGEARRRTAAALSEAVTAAMAELGMAGGRFGVAVEPAREPARHGADAISFRVTANPGQPLRPLARVASGGELARIALAFQMIAAEASPIPCLVFDEVDSGVGGRVAEIVGRELRRLGERRQVLCVTHLPQVAACAHHQVRVDKRLARGRTRVEASPLDGEGRVEEIARMLGGLEVTERTRAHARELLERAARSPSAGGPSARRRRAGA